MAKAKKKAVARSVRKQPAKRKSVAAPKSAPKRAKPAKTGKSAKSAMGVKVTPTLQSERARLARNKKLVLAFYQKMIGDKDPEAARRYMGKTYVQHSAYAEDGFEGVAAFAKQFKAEFPQHRYEVKKVIAEGDFVVLHLHGINGMSPHGEQVVDMFRVRDGKVVEHWDVIQPIPADARNPNGTF